MVLFLSVGLVSHINIVFFLTLLLTFRYLRWFCMSQFVLVCLNLSTEVAWLYWGVWTRYLRLEFIHLLFAVQFSCSNYLNFRIIPVVLTYFCFLLGSTVKSCLGMYCLSSTCMHSIILDTILVFCRALSVNWVLIISSCITRFASWLHECFRSL